MNHNGDSNIVGMTRVWGQPVKVNSIHNFLI